MWPFKKEPKIELRDVAPIDFNDEEGRQLMLERRRVLIPYLKRKWIEEAKEIERSYMKIMMDSVPVNLSIERRLLDYERQVRELGRHNANAFSDRAKTELLAKIEELKFIRSTLEAERLKK